MPIATSAPHRLRRFAVSFAVVVPIAISAGCGSDSTASDTPSTGSPTTTTIQGAPTMKRTTINPWDWSVESGFTQGELVEGGQDVLYLAGQTSMDAEGRPQHAGDMAAQVTLALDNLEEVLQAAGMDLSNVVRLNTYTTDIDAMFANYGIVAERLGAAGVQPPGSLLGVSRLAYPELMVELEATAVR